MTAFEHTDKCKDSVLHYIKYKDTVLLNTIEVSQKKCKEKTPSLKYKDTALSDIIATGEME
jgi:hypothetical protein